MSRVRVEVWVTREQKWEPLDFSCVKFNGFDVVVGYADFRILVDDAEVFSTLKEAEV